LKTGGGAEEAKIGARTIARTSSSSRRYPPQPDR